ncbi:O-antigen ligase family protein [Halobacillus sp. SY10]|uniref:O-antigen ligase family protein n=1 Tax=Halobacillus sp. SY10 TaxID=3381356 RepID=UPI003879E4C3
MYKRFSFFKILMLIYILCLIGWIVQYVLGAQNLLLLGYKYGTNFEHFNSLLRLPSIVGTPGNFSILLALLGFILEKCIPNEKKHYKWILNLTTLLFLILSTKRFALLFWVIAQLVYFLVSTFRKSSKRTVLFNNSMIFLFLPILTYTFYFILDRFNYFASNSLFARFKLWGEYLYSPFSLEGIIGLGLGKVGAASRRMEELNYNSLNYSVDNQYLAIYQQVGIIGLLITFALILIIGKKLLFTYVHNGEKNNLTALSLFSGLIIVSFFTNILELYPFNVFLWMFVGYNLLNEKTINKGVE